MPPPSFRPRMLSIEQLEAGILELVGDQAEHDRFCDQNVAAFRETVRVAIRETTEALSRTQVSDRWHAELKAQVRSLRRYAALADRYMIEQLSDGFTKRLQ